MGAVEFAPRADLGLVYHSNVYRAESDAVGGGNLLVQPGLAIEAKGDDHEFQFDGEWGLQKFLFVGGDEAERPERVSSLDRFDTFTVNTAANLFKQSALGFRVSDQAARRNWVVDALAAEAPYLSMFRNAFDAGLRTNPAPALELTPTFGWTYDSFQGPLFDPGQEGRGLNVRSTLSGGVDAKWSFLPHTALVANGDFANNSWQTNVVQVDVSGGTNGEVPIPNSDMVKVTAGLDGRFTARLYAIALLGFGGGYFAEKSVANAISPVVNGVSAGDGILTELGVKYALVPASETTRGAALTLGYTKDFRSSFFTNYVSFNQLSASLYGSIGTFQPSVRYEARFEGYNGAIERNDVVHLVRGTMAWIPGEAVQVQGDLGFVSRLSTIDNVEYDDVQLNLRTVLTY